MPRPGLNPAISQDAIDHRRFGGNSIGCAASFPRMSSFSSFLKYPFHSLRISSGVCFQFLFILPVIFLIKVHSLTCSFLSAAFFLSLHCSSNYSTPSFSQDAFVSPAKFWSSFLSFDGTGYGTGYGTEYGKGYGTRYGTVWGTVRCGTVRVRRKYERFTV